MNADVMDLDSLCVGDEFSIFKKVEYAVTASTYFAFRHDSIFNDQNPAAHLSITPPRLLSQESRRSENVCAHYLTCRLRKKGPAGYFKLALIQLVSSKHIWMQIFLRDHTICFLLTTTGTLEVLL